MKRKNKPEGFTLIELLIVVLIIAILAAIAVPNFLEFQVRAKVSRVMSDQRTLATALEAYTVDNGTPPMGRGAWTGYPNTPATPSDWGNYAWHSYLGLIQLTSPISYMSTIPRDPFFEEKLPSEFFSIYRYSDFVTEHLGPFNSKPHRLYDYYWSLHSLGPMRVNTGEVFIVRLLTGEGVGGDAHAVYNPTNGTISLGAIVRTNKGVFNGQPGN